VGNDIVSRGLTVTEIGDVGGVNKVDEVVTEMILTTPAVCPVTTNEPVVVEGAITTVLDESTTPASDDDTVSVKGEVGARLTEMEPVMVAPTYTVPPRENEIDGLGTMVMTALDAAVDGEYSLLVEMTLNNPAMGTEVPETVPVAVNVHVGADAVNRHDEGTKIMFP
jgi:hypothetical protein